MKTFDKVLPSLQKERRSVQQAIDKLESERKALRDRARSLDRAIQALTVTARTTTPTIDDVRESIRRCVSAQQTSETDLRQLVRDDLKNSGFSARGLNSNLDAVLSECEFEIVDGKVLHKGDDNTGESERQTNVDQMPQPDD